MPLLKSEKAKHELASKQRTLSVRERSALFLADGIRSRDELVHLLQGDIGMLQKLMESGYLVALEGRTHDGLCSVSIRADSSVCVVLTADAAEKCCQYRACLHWYEYSQP